MRDGKYIEGKVLVWRYPVMKGDRDIKVFTAIAPPKNLPAVPRNGVMFSVLDWGITRLSGGDYDGDIACYTTEPALLEIMVFMYGTGLLKNDHSANPQTVFGHVDGRAVGGRVAKDARGQVAGNHPNPLWFTMLKLATGCYT